MFLLIFSDHMPFNIYACMYVRIQHQLLTTCEQAGELTAHHLVYAFVVELASGRV
jgi:hypothetical protein